MANNRLKAALAVTGAAASLALALRERARRKNRIDFAGKSVVITGGSRGPGLVLVRQFAAEGARPALLARSASDLQRAAEELRSSALYPRNPRSILVQHAPDHYKVSVNQRIKMLLICSV